MQKQVRMHYRSGTTAGQTLITWQQFSAWNDVMADILKLWRQIENPTQPINVDLIEEQSCQISSRSDLKWRSLRLFWRGCPKKKTKISSWLKKSGINCSAGISQCTNFPVPAIIQKCSAPTTYRLHVTNWQIVFFCFITFFIIQTVPWS